MKRTAAVLSFGFTYAFASACCGVSPSGQPVTFGDQSNIIVWNAETKTEHFIRNAHFDSKAKDFGFIAATPSVPELDDRASKEAFDFLAKFQPPETNLYGGDTLSAEPAAAAPVEMLQQVDVGKYQATTVRSDDSSAMAAYLKANGYDMPAGSKEWVAFYTGKKWVFTAFKVRKKSEGQSETGIIRMSFKTDEPFNPYYVPLENSSRGGILKVYFVSDGVYRASIGHGGKKVSARWNNQIEDQAVASLAELTGIQESEFPKKLGVTYFEKQGWLDGSKDDLFFKRDSSFKNDTPAKNDSRIRPYPIAVLVAIAALWWFTKTRKAKILPG
jgi:hypothetical protein